jgi:hypothetical protein
LIATSTSIGGYSAIGTVGRHARSAQRLR